MGRILATGFGVLGFFGPAAAFLALALRSAPLLLLFGIAMQRRDGALVERWRAGLRSLVAWSPLLVAATLGFRLPDGVEELLIAVALVGAGWSVFRPTRGPVDQLVGTVLVPK